MNSQDTNEHPDQSSVHARMHRPAEIRTIGCVTTTTAERQTTSDAAARATGVAGVIALLCGLVIWGTSEGLRSVDFPERRVKGWCSLVVALAAVVQLASMTLATRSPSPARALMFKRVHRMSGMTALILGGFVTYLCFTFPYRSGATLHRVTGFVICVVVLAKLSLIRTMPRRFGVIALCGLLLVIGFQIEFITKGVAAAFGGDA